MMPEDDIDQLHPFDAVYLGAVGFPSVPDHASIWGLLIPIRCEFDQYVNLRPVRLFEGVPYPSANKKPGDIDFYVVRENVEGAYSVIGRIFNMKVPNMRSSLSKVFLPAAGPIESLNMPLI
jgi:tartrate dehydrogenase/decarboxylase/D-malate dehydrogenase